MDRAAPASMNARELTATVAVLSAMALVVLDAGLLNVALPTIARSLAQDASKAILIVSGYQAALLVGLLPCAQLAERLGARAVFLAGVVTFMAASLVCAVAPSFVVLIAARVFQGLGGAAILALGIALLRIALGPQRLGAAIGWNALTVALCAAAGPIVGAAVLAVVPWQWLFLIKLPIGMITLAATSCVPKVCPTRAALDLSAIILHAAAAAVAFVGAVAAPAAPPVALLLAAIALVLAAILIGHDRSARAPLWPVDLLAIRPLRVAVTASVFCFTGQSAALLALPFYLQLGLHRSVGSTALALTCWPLAVAVVGPIASLLCQRFSSALLCTVAAVMLSAGVGGAALASGGESTSFFAAAATVGGLGFGLFQVPNNRTMFLLAPIERSAAAGGLQGSARLLGQTLGALLLGFLMACMAPATAARSGLALAAVFTSLAAAISALEVPMRSARSWAKPISQEGRTT